MISKEDVRPADVEILAGDGRGISQPHPDSAPLNFPLDGQEKEKASRAREKVTSLKSTRTSMPPSARQRSRQDVSPGAVATSISPPIATTACRPLRVMIRADGWLAAGILSLTAAQAPLTRDARR
jgi:hypothetical protein